MAKRKNQPVRTHAERAPQAQEQEQEAAAPEQEQEAAAPEQEQEAAAPEQEQEAAAPEPTAEELEAQRAADFETAVEEARTDIQGCHRQLMAKHEIAVISNSAHVAEKNAWENKNVKAIETRAGAQVRISAARTALMAQWNERVGDNLSEETVGDGEEAQTFLSRLNFGFDELADPEDPSTELEKEYWLSGQSYNRIAQSIAKEPENLAELGKTANEARDDYEGLKAIYDEALQRIMTS